MPLEVPGPHMLYGFSGECQGSRRPGRGIAGEASAREYGGRREAGIIPACTANALRERLRIDDGIVIVAREPSAGDGR